MAAVAVVRRPRQDRHGYAARGRRNAHRLKGVWPVVILKSQPSSIRDRDRGGQFAPITLSRAQDTFAESQRLDKHVARVVANGECFHDLQLGHAFVLLLQEIQQAGLVVCDDFLHDGLWWGGWVDGDLGGYALLHFGDVANQGGANAREVGFVIEHGGTVTASRLKAQ